MSSIILEAFDMYILDFWFVPPQEWTHRFQPDMLPYTLQTFGVYLALLLPWALFQLLTLKKRRRTWLRYLPLGLSIICLAVSEVLYAVLTGWDALLGHILAFAALYWLLGAALGALVHWLVNRRKRGG